MFYMGSQERSVEDKAKAIATDYAECVLWAAGIKHLVNTNTSKLTPDIIDEYFGYANEQLAFVLGQVIEILCADLSLSEIKENESGLIDRAKSIVANEASKLNTQFMLVHYKHVVEHPHQTSGYSAETSLQIDDVIRKMIDDFGIELSTRGFRVRVLYWAQIEVPKTRISFERMLQIHVALFKQL